MKREHTELSIQNRKLVNDLAEKERDLKKSKAESEKTFKECMNYRLRFEQQEGELDLLKKINAQTLSEFEVFKNDVKTKNDLISDLKEQIVEASRAKQKEEEKTLRNSEIAQLKQLVQELTTQIINRDSIKNLTQRGAQPAFQATEVHCDADQSDCTEVDDQSAGHGCCRRGGHHMRVNSCATQTEEVVS